MLVRQAKDTDGKEKIEIVKYCDCASCMNNLRQKKGVNSVAIYANTVTDILLAKEKANKWICGGRPYSHTPEFVYI